MTGQVERLLSAAAAARQQGREEEAMRHVSTALSVAPDNPLALNASGVALLQQGQAEAAKARFKRAVEADPAAPALWMNLAKAERLAGDDEGERFALERALQIDQRHLMANIRLAELHERRGETRDAHLRWAGVLQLTASLGDVAELKPMIAHGQAYVAEQTATLATRLDARLGTQLAASDETTRRRFAAARDVALGRRRAYANQCAGVFYPFLPADEFFDRRHFPWFADLEAAAPAIRAELEALLASDHPDLAPYVEQPAGTPDNIWSKLNNSLDWSALYLWKYGEPQTRVLEACPATAAAVAAVPLANIPGRGPTVFFSILRPGSRIPPHTGVTNVRAIVHLPLVVPSGCGFRVGGEVREWKEGHAFAFDDTIEHEAWNESDQPRAVLILDTWNPHLTQEERLLLAAFFEETNEGVAGGKSFD